MFKHKSRFIALAVDRRLEMERQASFALQGS
jgi:hypothetical protein